MTTRHIKKTKIEKDADASRTVFVTQIRSSARTKQAQVRTLEALGLGRRGQSNKLPDNPAVRGMLRKVLHWLEVRSV